MRSRHPAAFNKEWDIAGGEPLRDLQKEF